VLPSVSLPVIPLSLFVLAISVPILAAGHIALADPVAAAGGVVAICGKALAALGW